MVCESSPDVFSKEFVFMDGASSKIMESNMLSKAFGQGTGLIGPQVRRLFGGDGASNFVNQYGTPGLGGGFQGTPVAQESSGPLPPLVPTISIMERYDSNVFNAPRVPGLDRGDFVTRISPQLAIQSAGLVSGSAQVGATGEIYAKHHDLNYIGGNVGAALDFTRLVQQAVPRMTVAVSETFLYTPQPPAFLGGEALSASGVPASQDLADSYARGLQVQRVNVVSNTVGGVSTYALTPAINIYATANYAILRFGSRPGNQQQVLPLLSSDTQIYQLGPEFKFSTNENVRMLFLYNRTDYRGATDGSSRIQQFESMGGRASYSRSLFAPSINGFASVEVQQINPGNQLQYTGSIVATWTRHIDVYSISYSRRIAPSYVGAGGALVSDLVGVNVNHRFSNPLFGNLQATYAHNSVLDDTTAAGGPKSFSFDSYIVSAGFRYQLMLGLNVVGGYSYTLFDSNGLSPAAGVTGASVSFDRHIAIIQLTKAWY